MLIRQRSLVQIQVGPRRARCCESATPCPIRLSARLACRTNPLFQQGFFYAKPLPWSQDIRVDAVEVTEGGADPVVSPGPVEPGSEQAATTIDRARHRAPRLARFMEFRTRLARWCRGRQGRRFAFGVGRTLRVGRFPPLRERRSKNRQMGWRRRGATGLEDHR